MLRSLSLKFVSSIRLKVFLSAFLLIFSYPKFNIFFLVWIGLIPLLFSLDKASFAQAFRRAYLCGVLFFGGTIWWFGHVTVAGAIVAVLYLALYFGVFGLGVCFCKEKSSLEKLVFLPSLWVVLELTRSYVFTGFDWVSLGYSQYKNLWVIQIADMTGMFGVSFVIVMINVFFKELFVKIDRVCVWLMLGVIFCVFGYGAYRIQIVEKNVSGEMNIAVVQANIKQEMKWQELFWPEIIEKHLELTREVSRENPDLIIWPETAFPGFLGEDEIYFPVLQKKIQEIGVPLLFGSVVKEKDEYYNAAVLLSENGEVFQKYRKRHLVPFGEFIPFRKNFPFLSEIIPIADFSRGTENTVFQKGKEKFSTLICFEDTLGRLARKFVQEGAGVLINITNDAWFKDTAAPFMHLQSAVFRTVENRRWLVRAANTGVSGFISPIGNVEGFVQDEQGKKTFVEGVSLKKIYFYNQKTFYTKFGDVFAYLCFSYIIICILNSYQKKYRKIV